ncbi:nitronate monooxygenase [Salicibibacter kimchii]|uniref:NAD(P)H-dependent flavin oxidoreductase n=1 Tax=Salicibibacter kimchii TaxID=2099786 RepID=UPI0030011D8F
MVITSLGNPSEVIDIVHRYGGLVYSDVATVKHAKQAARGGVDGLVLVCSGAGGHGGALSPFTFIHTVKEFFRGKIVLAGGDSTGSDVAAAQLMGADYVYMGTRFIATEESNAQKEYKQMVIDSALEDIIYTDAFSGIHANYLIPSLHRQGIDPKTLKPKEEIDLSHITDVKAWRDIWSAGQGVTTVKKLQTVGTIIQQLEQEYQEGMNRLV